FGEYVSVPLAQAAGRITCDIVTIYPPAVPILLPGEEISAAAVDYLQFLGRHGARIDGVVERPEAGIRVLAH
ncbi:MAG: ornithine decarboxylase, partial [candidate division NC10 bacterium]